VRYVVEIVLWQVVGIAAGMLLVVAQRWRDERKALRAWFAVQPGPLSTKLPTTTMLISPDWATASDDPEGRKVPSTP
jgi:hypothetical protein